MIDYIADYIRDIRKRRVFPDVKPGYMRKLVPDTAPSDGEEWDKIFSDVERVIMPGVSSIIIELKKSSIHFLLNFHTCFSFFCISFVILT